MKPLPGVFESFYDSAWQHPGLLFAAALVGLAIGVSRRGLRPELRRFIAMLACLSLADAWLTADPILLLGTGPLELAGAATTLVPLFFVIAGDYRYLLLVSSAEAGGALAFSGRRALAAAGLAVIVPISSQLIVSLLPETLRGGRTLYLVYEISFVILVAMLLRFHPRARELPWVRSVSFFVMAYYAVWVLADVWILTGSDVGFLLRVVPNVLYYGGLLAFIGWIAARATRADRASGT